MRLIPRPGDVIGLAQRGVDTAENLAGLLPRAVALLEEAERAVRRVHEICDGAESAVTRTTALVDRLEPSLTTLQPVLDRLAETTEPAEVDALVALVDQLPDITAGLQADVLPVMRTLGTVGDDVHELLRTTGELNDMIGRLPGMGMIRRRAAADGNDSEE